MAQRSVLLFQRSRVLLTGPTLQAAPNSRDSSSRACQTLFGFCRHYDPKHKLIHTVFKNKSLKSVLKFTNSNLDEFIAIKGGGLERTSLLQVDGR